ncbi:MAG: BlaI/MecI/CopY family transcriptional regulator [Candidatus Omnitrophota bacterium]
MGSNVQKTVLAKLETLVMKEVWKRGRATVHEVRDALDEKRNLAYTTILTTLRNLEKKGFLEHELEGRSHVYTPKIDEKTVEASSISNLLYSLFDGSKVKLVQALFEAEPLTKEEYEDLKQAILDRKKRESRHE